MGVRVGLSKRVRFDVFKRDRFECQYCGAHPPGAVLHVDHIRPVADGGTNDIDNLVTACQPCNQGKAARLLSSIPMSLSARAVEVKEREQQIRGYQAVIEGKALRINKEVDRVIDVFESFKEGYTLNDYARPSIRRFIEAIGVHEVMDSMEIACTTRGVNQGNTFKYFCGVCWRKIKDA